MIKKDYYREYYDFIHEVIYLYLDEIEENRSDLLLIYGHTIKIPLADLLFLIHMDFRDEYNRLRSQGYLYDELKELVRKKLESSYPYDDFPKNENKDEFMDTASLNPLQSYIGCPVFYSYNLRDVEYLKPLLSEMTQPVVLLIDFELDDTYQLGEQVNVIEFEPMMYQQFFNPYLQCYFPGLYYYFVTFYTIFYYLRPSFFICTEGCHYMQKTGALISRQMNIPSICLQRSWPSLFHTRFRNMEYTYFFTWGEFFNPLWKKYNSIPEFISVGYMYEVKKKICSKKITFFLQSPLLLLDGFYFDECIKFFVMCAKNIPDWIFQYREHPEYKLTEKHLNLLCKYSNIVNVSETPLPEVFSHTELVVSVFSSTLMEGVIHGCVPFSFDPVDNSYFYPDPDALGIGIIVKDPVSGLSKIRQFCYDLSYRSSLQRNIYRVRNKVAIRTSEQTLTYMDQILKKEIRLDKYKTNLNGTIK